MLFKLYNDEKIYNFNEISGWHDRCKCQIILCLIKIIVLNKFFQISNKLKVIEK